MNINNIEQYYSSSGKRGQRLENVEWGYINHKSICMCW